MSHIILKNVNLYFKTKREKRIKDFLVKGSNKFNKFSQEGIVHAIKNMNLEIKEGERVSIIGHNGAGKSTFLKMISGIYPPTNGILNVSGKISSMFELSTGFEMESSGWDNIYLRGLMLGETPSSIKEKMKEIAEFSELGEFLDMPVKYYSSGMFVRLAFSVSTAIKPDILLLDEIVAAGDASFLKKAEKRMNEMIDVAKIMVLVTHSMKTAKDLTNRCLWFEKGKIVMDGKPKEVIKEYLKNVKEGK
jgi:O-antigen export system ATP-binding protein rfbB